MLFAITEADFRWAVSNDPMASDKVAERIRQFHKDSEKLRKMLRAAVSA